MLKFENKEFRNLQEQVLKNAQDIQDFLIGENVLNQFGIMVLGQFNTENELPLSGTNYGDAYAIGTQSPYELYIWTRNVETGVDFWFNIGTFPLAGPQGPQGLPGETGAQGERGNSVLTYSEDAPGSVMTLEQITSVGWKLGDTYINALSGDVWVLVYNTSVVGFTWALKGNIRGPQGAQGQQGVQGIQGETGPQGPVGPQGDPGDIIKIVDILTSTSQLPLPTTVDHTTGYLVGTAAPYHLYIILAGDGQEDQKWFDTGAFGDFELVNITVPLSATSGTLTGDQLSILQNSPYNMINLNGEYFRLNDDKSTSGYLVYSHIGSTDGTLNPYSKLITVTLSGGSWVLTEDRLATYDEIPTLPTHYNLEVYGSATSDDKLEYNTTSLKKVIFGTEFYCGRTDDNTLLVELLEPIPDMSQYYTKTQVDGLLEGIETTGIEEVQQWKMTGNRFYRYLQDKTLVKTVDDISTPYVDNTSIPTFYNYIRNDLLGLGSSSLDCSAVIGFFLSGSSASSEVPVNFVTYLTFGGVVPADIDSFKIECVGAYQSAAECIINITVWTRDAREFELVMFAGPGNYIAGNWQEKTSKAYVDESISNAIGDINTVLDAINGEVI